MTDFVAEVQTRVGPVLEGLGFHFAGADDSPDKGGRPQTVVYYRSDDCKMQIYRSSREGETNCMIGPLDAPDCFGLGTDKWQFLTRFSDTPDVPLAELAKQARADYESYSNPLDWVKARILSMYETAHLGILHMYPAN